MLTQLAVPENTALSVSMLWPLFSWRPSDGVDMWLNNLTDQEPSCFTEKTSALNKPTAALS